MVLIKHSIGSKVRTLHNNPTSKLRSRPLVDKQVLSTATRPLLSSLLVSATRRRSPPRPRPTAASFFSLYEPTGILKGRATSDAGVPSVASTSTLEDDIKNSRILSSLAETTDGRSLDASYFGVTYRNSTLNSSQGPVDHYANVCPSPVVHAVASGSEEADDLPDFEPDSPEPGNASLTFDAGVNAATEDLFSDVKPVLEFGEVAPPTIQLLSAIAADGHSDTDDGDSGSELEDGASLSVNDYQNESVSVHEAVSFLDNVLFPLEESRMLPPSPISISRQPTSRTFAGLRLSSLAMADYQDTAVGGPAPLGTHSYMELAMGDGAVQSDPFLVYLSSNVAPTQQCFPVHQPSALTTAVYQDTDSGAPAPRVMISDMDLAMVDEATHPAAFVAFPTSTSVLPDPFSNSDSHGHMENVELIPHVPCNTTFPTSLWTIRESVQIPENDNDLFGLHRMSYDNMELCEADDMEMAEDPDVDLLTSLFSSALRLDVEFCTKCSAPQDPFCQCHLNTVADCMHCSAPPIPSCLCLQLKALFLPPSDSLLVPPYPRALRKIWHPPLSPPMDVDEGLSLAELSLLDLSVPNAGVTLDRRRRRRQRQKWKIWVFR